MLHIHRYKVVFKSGTLVRKTADLNSDQVAILCCDEVVMVDRVLPNYMGSFRCAAQLFHSYAP